MKLIGKEGFAELKVKNSTFLAYAIHLEQFERKLHSLRNEHRKANHIVWASKKLLDNGNIELKSTDDGEPKGTAGKPTLNVLKHSEIVNVAILTVRYFGGILLGTGGLVKAYTEVANLALKNSTIIDIDEQFKTTFKVDFKDSQRTFYLIKKYGIKIENQQYGNDGLILQITGKKEFVENLIKTSKQQN